jgi:uncharacterized protein (TIGR02246 family)
MPARSPEDCDRLFAECINAGDVEGVAKLYEPRASLVQQDGSTVTGPAAIREALAGFAALKPRIKMNVTRVVKAGDDLAVLYNHWTLRGIGPDGQPLEMTGKAIEVVRRQRDGNWLFAVDDPFAGG